jgi:hypothetical protein
MFSLLGALRSLPTLPKPSSTEDLEEHILEYYADADGSMVTREPLAEELAKLRALRAGAKAN